MVPPPHKQHLPLRSVLVIALWLGLLAGYAEVLGMGLRLYVLEEFLTLSPHAIWMAPVVNGLLFVAVALGCVLCGRLVQRLGEPGFIVGTLVSIAVLALLLPYREIHLAASALLAVGVGVQAGRRTGDGHRLHRLAVRGVTGLAVITVVAGSGFLLRSHLRYRNSLAAGAPADAPSILLIILDTVRARSMSLYGNPRPTTPNLERLGREGMVIERAISPAPWTLPSHAVMFTGRSPVELATNWNTPLEREPPTIAEVLSGRGYATAGFVANYRYAGWETGVGRGFELYDDYPVTLGEAIRSAAFPNSVHKTIGGRIGLPNLRPRVTAADINRRFLSWFDRKPDSLPWFVFLNYLDAHDPYDPSSGFQQAFAPGPRGDRPRDGVHVTEAMAQDELRLYEAAIAYLDSAVNGLLEELDRRGALANTLVVITSDHGEEFAEHEIMGHAASLYRPSVEVPLLFWFPGRVPAGRAPGPAGLRHLPATILDLAGAADHPLPGRSLRGEWERRDTALSHIRRLINQPDWWPATQGDMVSLVLGDYRYIYNLGTGQEQLYNFEDDPEERRDLAATPSGAAQLPRFRAALQAFSPPLSGLKFER